MLQRKAESEEKEERRTPSGIIIPDSAKDDLKGKKNTATVVAVGPECGDFGVHVGDSVIYSDLTMDEVKLNGVKYLIVEKDAILAIVKKTENAKGKRNKERKARP